MRGIYSLKTLSSSTSAPLIRKIIGTFVAVMGIGAVIFVFSFTFLILKRVPREYLGIVVAYATLTLTFFSAFCLIFLVWITHNAVRPLSTLVKWAREARDLESPQFDGSDSQEIQEVYTVFSETLGRLRSAQDQLLKSERDAAVGQISSQLAHDIRSPLAALEVACRDTDQVSEETRLLIRSAVARIRDIANHLVKSGVTTISAPKIEAHLVSDVLENIISEKRLQFRPRYGLEIVAPEWNESSYGLFAKFDLAQMKRILSNIINNAVEAMPSGSNEAMPGDGRVSSSLRSLGSHVEIRISDSGVGIPPEVLGRLGERGFTYGKAGGSGLGLFHARKTLEAWGGTLGIESMVGVGTTVILTLPKGDTPSWFVPAIQLDSRSRVIVLDDDPSVHQVWDARLPGYDVRHFSCSGDLVRWMEEENGGDLRKDDVYLFDVELRGENVTGIDLVERFDLRDSAILVTSRFEEPGVQSKCRSLGVGLIPKGLAGFVPISSA